MSYKDDVKIFINILGQSPEGLNDPQLIGKFAKAKAMINAMDSYTALQGMGTPVIPEQTQPVVPDTPQSQNNAVTGTMPSQPVQTPNQMNEGQGSLILP